MGIGDLSLFYHAFRLGDVRKSFRVVERDRIRLFKCVGSSSICGACDSAFWNLANIKRWLGNE